MSASYRGIMIVNAFLHSAKFEEIYEWLKEASRHAGLFLDVCTNADILTAEDDKALCEKYDFCLFWDKDILLARRLERAGLRLFNSSEAIEICDDKALTYERMLGKVKMPETIDIPFTFSGIGYDGNSFLEKIGDRLGYPYVIKENKGSFGAQVYLADSIESARNILKKTDARPAIAQRFIESSSGRDIRINMVGDRAVAAMERYNDNDFRANITNGGSMRVHEVTECELEIARSAMREIGLDFAGVDILCAEDGPLLCEVNSNAHFKNIFDCTGVNVADYIMEYIRRTLEENN